MITSIYTPKDNPDHLNDPIAAHGDQLLAEWAWNFGHRAVMTGDEISCSCGRKIADDAALRKHWLDERNA